MRSASPVFIFLSPLMLLAGCADEPRDAEADAGALSGAAAEPVSPAEATAAIAFRHVDGGKAQLCRRADPLFGDDMLLVPFGSKGRDAIGGEAPRHVLNGLLFLGKLELARHVSRS